MILFTLIAIALVAFPSEACLPPPPPPPPPQSVLNFIESIIDLVEELEGDVSSPPGSKPFPSILGPAKDDQVER